MCTQQIPTTATEAKNMLKAKAVTVMTKRNSVSVLAYFKGSQKPGCLRASGATEPEAFQALMGKFHTQRGEA